MEMEFRDKCVITRDTGKYDKYGNAIVKTIYDGACHYEKGGQSNVNRMLILNPMIFLPSNDVLVKANDTVTVETFFPRTIIGIVESVRDIRFTSIDCESTRIELKQASEK